MLILLDYLQLRSGSGVPILADCERSIHHLHNHRKPPENWILALRSFLATCKGSIEVAESWIPDQQRDGDLYIMDELDDGTATAGELKLANEVRMYKRVITLSDLVSIDGTTIVAEVMVPITSSIYALEPMTLRRALLSLSSQHQYM